VRGELWRHGIDVKECIGLPRSPTASMPRGRESHAQSRNPCRSSRLPDTEKARWRRGFEKANRAGVGQSDRLYLPSKLSQFSVRLPSACRNRAFNGFSAKATPGPPGSGSIPIILCPNGPVCFAFGDIRKSPIHKPHSRSACVLQQRDHTGMHSRDDKLHRTPMEARFSGSRMGRAVTDRSATDKAPPGRASFS
jgi:hypothetical protein